MRELENVLERAGDVCASDGVIDAGRPAVAAQGRRTPRSPIQNSVAPGEKLGDALEDIERDAIVRALEQTRYNKTKAAQLLGMTLPLAALPDQEARHRVRAALAGIWQCLLRCVANVTNVRQRH